MNYLMNKLNEYVYKLIGSHNKIKMIGWALFGISTLLGLLAVYIEWKGALIMFLAIWLSFLAIWLSNIATLLRDLGKKES